MQVMNYTESYVDRFLKNLSKASEFIFDPAERLHTLVNTWDLKLRREFLEMVKQIRSSVTLDRLTDLIVRGQIDQAFAEAEAYVLKFADATNEAFTSSARSTADFYNTAGIAVTFDRVNTRAVEAMQQNQLRLVREFLDEQRRVTRQAMVEGISQGLNPRDQARMFRDSIGLTERQERAVARYRTQLEQNDLSALRRQLRDRRFDRTFRRAVKDGKFLNDEQIDRMVGRYRERYIKYRSEVIARTEALRSTHQGNEELYRQAFETGKLNPEEVVRGWSTEIDGRERPHHHSMNNQERSF